MIVTVVPIQRLRRATRGWSYSVSEACQPGSLVRIPFRGRSCYGIVWAIEEAPVSKLEKVEKVLTTKPLLLAPHRTLIEHLADYGIISLSTALHIWLPAALRGVITAPNLSLLQAASELELSATYLATHKQQLAVRPSLQTDASNALEQKLEGAFWNTFQPETPKQELEQWLAVRTGKIQVVFGRDRALFAPFLNLRHLIVGDVDDPAYFHDQLPYLGLQAVAQKLAAITNAQLVLRSYLPPSSAASLWGGSVLSMPQSKPATLIDLHQEKLLSPILLEKIQTTIADGKKVVILYNAHDRIKATEDGMRKLLPGVESIRKQLAQFPANSLIIGTRAIFAETHRNVGLSIALQLDSQLNPQHFADEISLWADLGHLMSFSGELVVQAFTMNDPVIHALRNQQLDTHISTVLADRKTAGLPPFGLTIFLTIPEGNEQLMAEIHPQLEVLSNWQVSHPFTSRYRKQTTLNLAIHSSDATFIPEKLYAFLAKLARPWKVQVNPWHIL